MDAPALQARDLYRFFRTGDDETLALRGVSLTVARGEVVAVVGPSGSGKSTLLSCLAGLDEPAGGTVTVGGERVSHRPEAERARIRARRIGILMQSRNLLPHLGVRANIRLAQLASDQDKRRYNPDELLEQVGLDGRGQAVPQELSGGELARAGLAVALANDPDIVLADEPTGELDGTSEQQILTLLRERVADGAGLLVVTPRAQVVRIAGRVLSLQAGAVVSCARPRTWWSAPLRPALSAPGPRRASPPPPVPTTPRVSCGGGSCSTDPRRGATALSVTSNRAPRGASPPPWAWPACRGCAGTGRARRASAPRNRVRSAGVRDGRRSPVARQLRATPLP